MSQYPDDPEVIAALKDKLHAEAEAARAAAASSREQVRFDKVSRKKHEIEYRKERHLERMEKASDLANFTYNFTDEVKDSSVNVAIAVLSKWLRQGATEITIVFTSPGGGVFAGFALYDFIMHMRNEGVYVTTVCRGYAASMAGILLQAGDRRVMGSESYLLIHEVSTGAVGKSIEIKDEAEFLDKMMERVYNIFSSRAKKRVTPKVMRKLVERKDFWVSADEALDYGFVDEIA